MHQRALLVMTATAALSACTAATRPSAAPAAGGDGAATAAAARPAARQAYGAADVRFMQMMIVHHEQALALTALVPERTTREDFRMLAERIEAAQQDEIARMKNWLARRGQSVPLVHADHAVHAMPGLLTAEDMARLQAARGTAFERLFLEYMIRHHEGALTMVAELYATPGAGEEPELFQFAQHVDADQRAEIARMRRMLNNLVP